MTSIADAARKKLAGGGKTRTQLGDKEIREYLLQGNRWLDALVIEEFGIASGKARADLAWVDDESLVGIEIKSDLDTVKRLANQSLHYTQFFEVCHVYTGPKFAKEVLRIMPREWGVHVVGREGSKIAETHIRSAQQNSVNYYRWLELLWREEVLDHFRTTDSHSGLTRLPKEELVEGWQFQHTAEETKRIVLNILMSRKDWRRRDPKTLHRF